MVDHSDKIGFIGAGNMAEALIKGLLAQDCEAGQSCTNDLEFAHSPRHVH